MYKKFVEFMKDFLDENSSPDYWYDVAFEHASEILDLFKENDWLELIEELDFQPLEFKRKLAYCLDSTENVEQLRVLLILANTEDSELLEKCVDSLRGFVDNNNIELILQNKWLIENVKQLLPSAGIVVKKVYDDFLLKIGEK